MNDNFLLYKYVKELSFEIYKYSNNIPKNLAYIKKNIQDAFDKSIRLIKYYIVNSNEAGRIKIKYLKDLIVEISMIDYYLETLYTFKVLGKNNFNKFASNLEVIRKLAYGVIKNEKELC